MKILFLSHYFPPEVNAPATRTFEHCRRWVELGHDVTVITCAPNCPTGKVFDGYRNTWRTQETVAGIQVVRVWSFLSANKGFLLRILNYVSYFFTAIWQGLWQRDVDVIVATSPQLFCGFAGVVLKFLKRKPCVLEIRDIWPESILAVNAMKPSPVIRLLEWLERWMYRAANEIVTVGEGYRRKLNERGVPDEKITVIPNGVDVRQFPIQPVDSSLRQEWDSVGKFVCAYIGTIGMAHGLEVILRAAEVFQQQQRVDTQFWIVGDGAEREALDKRANELGLKNVRFTGMVSRDKVGDVLRSCDCSVIHLRGTELFGTVIPSKVFETMALNVPIIMGVRGQAQEIVRSAGAGLSMTPDDAESLLTALETIRANPRRFAVGRDFVSREFDRIALADRMLALMERTAGQHSSSEQAVFLKVPAPQPTSDRKVA